MKNPNTENNKQDEKSESEKINELEQKISEIEEKEKNLEEKLNQNSNDNKYPLSNIDEKL
jgi:hypothetical protein